MHSRKSYQLEITTPCQEDWASMAPKEKGKFCTICAKSVVDFSKMTDEQIIGVLGNSSGNLCGRLTADQMQRNISSGRQAGKNRFAKVLAGLFLIGSTQQGLAQNEGAAPDTTVYIYDTSREPAQPMCPTTPVKANTKIRGIVLDAETKEPLIGAAVLFLGSQTGTLANDEGKFALKIPAELLQETIHLEVRYIGYHTFQYQIPLSELNTKPENILNLTLQSNIINMLGGIGYTRIRWYKPWQWRVWGRMRNWVR